MQFGCAHTQNHFLSPRADVCDPHGGVCLDTQRGRGRASPQSIAHPAALGRGVSDGSGSCGEEVPPPLPTCADTVCVPTLCVCRHCVCGHCVCANTMCVPTLCVPACPRPASPRVKQGIQRVAAHNLLQRTRVFLLYARSTASLLSLMLEAVCRVPAGTQGHRVLHLAPPSPPLTGVGLRARPKLRGLPPPAVTPLQGRRVVVVVRRRRTGRWLVGHPCPRVRASAGVGVEAQETLARRRRGLGERCGLHQTCGCYAW